MDMGNKKNKRPSGSSSGNKHKATAKVKKKEESWFSSKIRLLGQDAKSIRIPRTNRDFIIGILFVLISILLAISMLHYLFLSGAQDQSVLQHTGDVASMLTNEEEAIPSISNPLGLLGVRISYSLIDSFLGIGSLFIPLFLFLIGSRLVTGSLLLSPFRGFFFCLSMALWSATVASFLSEHTGWSELLVYPLGGDLGLYLSNWLTLQIGIIGEVALLFMILVVILVLCWSGFVPLVRSLFKKKEKTKKAPIPTVEPSNTPKTEIVTSPEVPPLKEKVSQEKESQEQDEKREVSLTSSRETITQHNQSDIAPSTNDLIVEVAQGEESDASENVAYTKRSEKDSPYQFPPLSLLSPYDHGGPQLDMEEIRENERMIIETLESFKIKARPTKATVGPAVTLYEIEPDAGIKISKIRGLEDDIARSLKSEGGIRIIAPIPGKGTIGIEVPNKKPQIVALHSLLSSKKYIDTTMQLPVAIGKTITNEVFMFDLAKMPHLLIAGATGQGKSVGLNVMITSLLYTKQPEELKFVMIDPKMLEFSIYEQLSNHYLAKLPQEDRCIITDMTKVIPTLQSLCVEMDNRYLLLSKAHARNITEYNDLFDKGELSGEEGHKRLPYIVLIVDEFADLIMTSGKEVERPITRIAQKARAAGIHMILATQRPTTDIITGTIKANFPARIAFKVFSAIDSKTILDATGANHLVGRGDMLFYQGKDMLRVQCALIDTPETQQIVNHIALQPYLSEGPMALPEVPLEEGDEKASASLLEKKDPMFEQVARMVVETGQGSTSKIQRQFEIGFNRAGRIMDQLEAAGIVSAQSGSKPREVLIQDTHTLDNLLESLK